MTAIDEDWQCEYWRWNEWQSDRRHNDGWHWGSWGEWQHTSQWSDARNSGYWRRNDWQYDWQYSEVNWEGEKEVRRNNKEGVSFIHVQEQAVRVEVQFGSDHIRRLINVMYDKETTLEKLREGGFACKIVPEGHKDRWCIVASHSSLSFKVYPSLINNCSAQGREGLLLVGRRGWRKQGLQIFTGILNLATKLLVSSPDKC